MLECQHCGSISVSEWAMVQSSKLLWILVLLIMKVKKNNHCFLSENMNEKFEFLMFLSFTFGLHVFFCLFSKFLPRFLKES